MSKPDKSIDPKILEAAKKEFLEKGYEKASTNVICKNAGVTWGALQKRYEGKDALFCALVSPVAEEFKATLIGANDEFHNLTKNRKPTPYMRIRTEINLSNTFMSTLMCSDCFCAVQEVPPTSIIWKISLTFWNTLPVDL